MTQIHARLLVYRYTNADLKNSVYNLASYKKNPESFALLNLRIPELFTFEVCLFLKK